MPIRATRALLDRGAGRLVNQGRVSGAIRIRPSTCPVTCHGVADNPPRSAPVTGANVEAYDSSGGQAGCRCSARQFAQYVPYIDDGCESGRRSRLMRGPARPECPMPTSIRRLSMVGLLTLGAGGCSRHRTATCRNPLPRDLIGRLDFFFTGGVYCARVPIEHRRGARHCCGGASTSSRRAGNAPVTTLVPAQIGVGSGCWSRR